MSASLVLALEGPPPAKPSLSDALATGKLELRLRLYSMDRLFEGDEVLVPRTRTKAIATGGWLTYQTTPWHGLSASLGGSASFKVNGDLENDGTGLLAPGQEDYSVVHQAFLQYDLGSTSLRAYRQTLYTPLITSLDLRMTPVTFEAFTAFGSPSSSVSWIASYVTGYKNRNDTEFVSMSEGAGYGGDNSVALAGVTWKPADWASFQLWDFYCTNIMNAPYVQADVTASLGRGWKLTTSLQGLLQRSMGDELAGEFPYTGFGAMQVAVAREKVGFHVAYSRMSYVAGMILPWSQNPDFTATAEEDQNLPGERAWAWGFWWDLASVGVPGLIIMWDRTKSYVAKPKLGMSHKDQYEAQAIVDYYFQGKLNGFKARLYGAWVESSLSSGTIFGQDYHDYRAVLYYNLSTTIDKLIKH